MKENANVYHNNCFPTNGLLLKKCDSLQDYMNKLNDLFWQVVALHDPADKGKFGDAAELCVRVYLRRFAAAIPAELWIAGQNKTDCTVSYKDSKGRRHTVKVEVKTGSGEINDINKSHFVAYCPEFNPEQSDIMSQFYVFTADDFLSLIDDDNYTAYFKSRSKSGTCKPKRIRNVHSNGRINIQSFRTATQQKASLPIREYIDDACMERQCLSAWEKALRNL